MIRIAICDDEPEQIEIIRELIVRVLFHLNMDASISTFTSGEDLLRSYSAGQGFDIIFQDISLSDRDGIDTAISVRLRDRKALVIFITGSTSFLQKGYEARAFRYLVKPATEQMMEEVLKKAMMELQLIECDCIRFKEKGEEIRVDLSEIIYFEAQNHKLSLICSNATHNFYGRIGEVERHLSEKGFVRCQKGYLVNAVRIRRIGKSQILLDNGKTIPVSSNYLKQTKDTFISVLR